MKTKKLTKKEQAFFDGAIQLTNSPKELRNLFRDICELSSEKSAQKNMWERCAENLYEVMKSAIESGDWKVDGACDPDVAMKDFLSFKQGNLPELRFWEPEMAEAV